MLITDDIVKIFFSLGFKIFFGGLCATISMIRLPIKSVF